MKTLETFSAVAVEREMYTGSAVAELAPREDTMVVRFGLPAYAH